MRGEDFLGASNSGLWSETPPRAWGRLQLTIRIKSKIRNTPHMRGEDKFHIDGALVFEETPHMRGEDRLKNLVSVFNQETPPHAWGRPI